MILKRLKRGLLLQESVSTNMRSQAFPLTWKYSRRSVQKLCQRLRKNLANSLNLSMEQLLSLGTSKTWRWMKRGVTMSTIRFQMTSLLWRSSSLNSSETSLAKRAGISRRCKQMLFRETKGSMGSRLQSKGPGIGNWQIQRRNCKFRWGFLFWLMIQKSSWKRICSPKN